jgi:hypothetical protein
VGPWKEGLRLGTQFGDTGPGLGFAIAHAPDLGLALVLLYEGEHVREEFLRAALEEIFGPPEDLDRSLPQERWKEYEGTYVSRDETVRHEVAYRSDKLVCPSALLVGWGNQDSLTLQSDINLRSNLGDSANTLRAYRGWEGRPDAIEAADEEKVRWVNRRRLHRDENILRAKGLLGDRVEFNHI